MAQQIQQRRDTAANWTSANPVLLNGQIGVETDTGQFKVGVSAATAWTGLDYVGQSVPLPAYPMREAYGGSTPLPGAASISTVGASLSAAVDSSVATARTLASTNGLTIRSRIGYVGPTDAISRNAGANFAVAAGTLRTPDPAIVGGFRFRIAAAISDANAAGQFGIGLWSIVGTWSASVEPSAAFNQICLAADSGDAHMQIMHNGASGGGAATKIDLGASFPNNTNMADLYELLIDFHSNGLVRTLNWDARNLANGAHQSGSIPDTAKMPVAGVMLGQFFQRGSANVATAPSIEYYGYQIGPLA